MLESIIIDSKGRSSNSTWTLTEITDPALKLSHGGGETLNRRDNIQVSSFLSGNAFQHGHFLYVLINVYLRVSSL